MLVQDGILTGYLWDWLIAKLSGNRPTGNGRRSSYRNVPLCHMTNTSIELGPETAETLMAPIRRGH